MLDHVIVISQRDQFPAIQQVKFRGLSAETASNQNQRKHLSAIEGLWVSLL